MILQALKEYSDRKGDALGGAGYEMRGIPFLIVVNHKGEFVDLQDTREHDGKRLKAKEYEVPQSQGRSGKDSWKTAFALWDHYGYVLGFSPEKEKRASAAKQHKAFVERVRSIHHKFPNAKGVKAVLGFFEKGDYSNIFSHKSWPECEKIKGCNLTFKLAGETELVCQSQDVRAYVASSQDDLTDDEVREGICLITGERSELMRLHPAIALPGLKKPAPLCAVNDDERPAFSSFRRSQGYNFPVGKPAARDYAKALNSLLKSSTQRLSISNTSLVFWAARESALESQFFDCFGDDPDRQARAVESLFKSVETGAYAEDSDSTRFYVLGMSPNAARIAIRFWIVDTVAGMAGKIRRHFEDTRIVHGPKDADTLSLYRLLISTAAL